MALADRRLNFIYNFGVTMKKVAGKTVYIKTSERELSRQTGIARSTLYDIKHHKYQCSEKHYQSIRNYFQRQAYSVLREAGLSSYKADRYKWYRPESIMEIKNRVGSVVSYLTNVRLQSHLTHLDNEGVSYDLEYEAQEIEEGIKESLRKSKKSVEDWETSL